MKKSSKARWSLPAALVCAQLLLTGCGSWWLPRAHKIDIQQGNVLPEEIVATIAEGMTRNEILNALGSPVADTISPERWDYIFSLNKAGETPNAKRLTLYFESDRVVQLEKEGFPETAN